MPPLTVLIAVISSAVEFLEKTVPGISQEISAILAKKNPQTLDWMNLHAKVAAESFAQLAPHAAANLPPPVAPAPAAPAPVAPAPAPAVTIQAPAPDYIPDVAPPAPDVVPPPATIDPAQPAAPAPAPELAANQVAIDGQIHTLTGS